ncbi:hypothetical protein [Nitrosomonas ureae]|uniref:Uncharacterized protein n=1 Tax=Nitrosomonas ureae TaxID=44577 RepID=A0A286A3P4_9PROT|nr:hypothetical protein [Nitrosomonas ureae]SOD16524.1 hypothetical protein SAMN06297164_0609 [Nitrosomonas ureae]
MKNIQIIDKSFGQKVGECAILVDLENGQTDQSFMDSAWKRAVAEGWVDENYRENYDMEIVGDIPLDHSSESL